MDQIKKHPEWKQLKNSIAPLVEAGEKFFDYETLRELAGIDIKSTRGRQQFIRFRREALKDWEIWFENERDKGYRIVEPCEHLPCSHNRTKQAKRRLTQGLAIATYVKMSELSDAQKTASLQYQALQGAILSELKKISKQQRQIIASVEHPQLAPTPQELELIQKALQ